ncbi:MAG TPA: tetratricopeptide repeat protein [Thermoanaerobaculia bacterium]|jgi:tetratricopeptide (TPR) repeat protein|nr:tetratricopeptide repeat protein [Thermoanaerobaculia bacterium]
MLSRIAKPMILLVAFLVAASVPAWSQSWAGRGRLQGQVRDESGKPIQGATVTLRQGTDRVDPKAEGPATIKTDKNGKWSILGLTSGAWGVLIEKEGYIPSEGQVSVNEFAVAQPVPVTLKVIPKEVVQQAEKESSAGQAKASIERGNALLAEGKYADARAAYQEGMAKLQEQKETQDPVVLVSIQRAIADTYHKEGKVDQAVDALKQTLTLAPDDPVTLQLLVNLLVGAGRESEAQTYMAKLPQGTKVDANTLLNIGIKSFNDGKMDQALGQFDRVVKENPDLPDAYYYRALVYLNQDKKTEAKADLQKLLQLDPNNKYAKDAKEFLKDLK